MLRRVAKAVAPPIVVAAIRHLRARRPLPAPSVPEWEYVHEGWATKRHVGMKGWNVPDVAAVYASKWPEFLRSLDGPRPFGMPVDTLHGEFDLAFHNTVMSFAHAVATAARSKQRLAMLDWGGALGHYSLIAKALFPDLLLDYVCKDLPMLTEQGRRLLPNVHFYSDDDCFAQRYDLVMASTSLQYVEKWREVANNLVRASDGFVFITGLPVVLQVPSFVFVQRPYAYGYNTEYLAWCFNRQEFLSGMQSTGAGLVREYVLGYRPSISKAPEQCAYRGYLFHSGKIR